jgi:hypothetical protein
MRRLLAPFLAAFLLAAGIGCLAKAQVGQTLWTPVLQSGFVPAPAFYVATAAGGGSDSNAGTLASPFLTLGKCQTAMQGSSGAKLTCYIRAGTYNFTGSTNCSANAISLTTSDAGETWSYYPPDGIDTAILDGGASSSSTGYVDAFFWSQGAGINNITINGLQFQHWCTYGAWNVNGYSGAGHGSLLFENNIVHDGYGLGADFTNLVHDSIVTHNYFYNLPNAAHQVLSASSSYPHNNITFSNNLTINTCTNGADCGPIYFQDIDGSGSTGDIIKNNYSANCGNGSASNGKCIYLDNGQSNTTVTGNVVTGTFWNALEINNGSSNSFSGDILDLETSGGPIVYNGSGPSNTIESEIVVMNNNSTQNGWDTHTGGTVTNNQYYAYAGTSPVTTGDSSPTTANPGFSCSWKYSAPSTTPTGWPGQTSGWGGAGFWGPTGFVLPENWTPTPSPGSGTC